MIFFIISINLIKHWHTILNKKKQTNCLLIIIQSHEVQSPIVFVVFSRLLHSNRTIEPWNEMSNNVVCATSNGLDQPAHMCSLIRVCASRLNITMNVKLLTKHYLEFLSLKGGCTGSSESTLVKMPHCWKSHVGEHIF